MGQLGEQETLRQEILEDARRKARRTVERAQREAGTLKERAQADLAKMREHVLTEARSRAERRRTVILAPLAVETRRETLRCRDRLVQKVFTDALDRLRDVGAYDYDQVLAGLILEAVEQMEGTDFAVTVNQRDRDRIGPEFLASVTRTLKERKQRTVSLVGHADTGTPVGGAVVTSIDGRLLYDNTFSARLDRLAGELRREVAGMLFEQSGESHE